MEVVREKSTVFINYQDQNYERTSDTLNNTMTIRWIHEIYTPNQGFVRTTCAKGLADGLEALYQNYLIDKYKVKENIKLIG
jgi:hypothetical protein